MISVKRHPLDVSINHLAQVSLSRQQNQFCHKHLGHFNYTKRQSTSLTSQWKEQELDWLVGKC